MACSGTLDAPTAGPVTASSPFVVSSPQTVGVTRDASGTGGSAAPNDVVYVALPPGSIPDAQLVTIRVHPTGVTVTANPANGGLDPVAVAATLGDTLYVDVQVSGRSAPVRYILPVGKHGGPVVIRTSPPHQKRDVPLNTNVLVVFSEPILPSSVNSGTVLLADGNIFVTAGIAFVDSTHIMSTLTPVAPLSPSTDYTLTISQSVQDLAGQTLAAPVIVTFTTAMGPVSQWSGSLGFERAFTRNSSISCEGDFATHHFFLFPQTANADLQIGDSVVQLTLRTSASQKVVFSGTRSGDSISVTSHHQSSDGWPLSAEMIEGIARTCREIDVVGDGPFWGDGTLVAHVGSSDLDGIWEFDTWDPGGGPPPETNRPMHMTIDLRIHLSR